MAHVQDATPRRGFLNTLTAGAAALGLTAILSPTRAASNGILDDRVASGPKSEADLWFDRIRGAHRVVYDVTQPHEIFPFAWPRVFLMTNAATGSPETDCGVVVVLRHAAIAYAMTDPMWSKYHFAEVFGATDHGKAFQAADAETAVLSRNPFWNTQPGDFKVPGIGAVSIGIKELQASGVMFCVCEAAMTVYANGVASSMGSSGEEVKSEWMQHLIPGIQPVPSGVWALGRAHEHDCAYIFAG